MIPQSIDRKLGELDDLAAGILVPLRVLRRNPKPAGGRRVRERLQIFCDAVIDTANEIIANG